MRFFSRRRRRTLPASVVPAYALNTSNNVPATTFTLRTTTPSPAKPEKEKPVPLVLTARQRKLYRVSVKREQRTAGQLAVRAGLAATDGSGRGVVHDLNALVKAGKLDRHGVKTPYSYTRAA